MNKKEQSLVVEKKTPKVSINNFNLGKQATAYTQTTEHHNAILKQKLSGVTRWQPK